LRKDRVDLGSPEPKKPNESSDISAAFQTAPKLFTPHPQDREDPSLESNLAPAEAGAGPGQSQTSQAQAEPSLSW